jgi:phosphoribosyl-ATP pyrophosphohydrolase
MAKGTKKGLVSGTVTKAARLGKAEKPSASDPGILGSEAVETISTRADVLDRLWALIENRNEADPGRSHSARLLARGTSQVVQRLGEEFVECLIEATSGTLEGLKRESADVLYHLLVVWVNADLKPDEVWAELAQREEISQLTEGTDVPLKRLLARAQVHTTKIP